MPTDRLRSAIRERPAPGVEAALRVLVTGCALAYVGAFLYVAASRLTYPLPLEWMEGGLVLTTGRVLAGRPIYVPPTIEFTPFIYPPLFFYVSAAVASITGLGFVPLRLVAVGATLGSFAFIALFVRRETDRIVPAVVAVGTFAAAYPIVDTWFDLARVDMLFVALALWTLYLVRFGRRARTGVLAGIGLALAFLAKQSALGLLPLLALYAIAFKRRFGVAFAASSVAAVAASVLAFQFASDGWFLYYLFELPTGHETIGTRYLTFWTDDLLAPFGIAAAFSLAFVLIAAGRSQYERVAFYTLAFGGLVGLSWQARLHDGGWPNTVIPAYAALAIGFGLAVGFGLRAASRLEDGDLSPAAIRVAVFAVVFVQLVSLAYVPTHHVPTADDRERADRAVQMVESMNDPVFSPIYPYVAARAGGGPSAHKAALADVLRASPHDAQERLRENLSASLTRTPPRYGTLLVYGGLRLADLDRAYRHERALGPEAMPQPIAGADRRPRDVFVPRNGTTGRTLSNASNRVVDAAGSHPSVDRRPTPVGQLAVDVR